MLYAKDGDITVRRGCLRMYVVNLSFVYVDLEVMKVKNDEPPDSEKEREEAREEPVERREQDAQEKREGIPRKVGISEFRIAFLATAIPIVVLSLISLGGAGSYMGTGLQFAWVIGAGFFAAALLTAIVLSIVGKGEIAGGIWAGIAIGIVTLGVTCFANIGVARYG